MANLQSPQKIEMTAEFYPVDANNLAECAELFVSVFNAPPWNENWRTEAVLMRLDECYRTPRFYGLLVKIEEVPIGFALGYGEQWDEHLHFNLREMYVTTQHQRAGIGAALMEQLEENLKARGVEKLYLYTAHDSGAQNFYEKQGFYVSPKMVMMAKWLSPQR